MTSTGARCTACDAVVLAKSIIRRIPERGGGLRRKDAPNPPYEHFLPRYPHVGDSTYFAPQHRACTC